MPRRVGTSRLKRPLQSMPADIRKALVSRRLTAAYKARPADQRNDYLSWIKRAKLAPTRKKRLNQMLDELRRGGLYMNMVYRPRRRSR